MQEAHSPQPAHQAHSSAAMKPRCTLLTSGLLLLALGLAPVAQGAWVELYQDAAACSAATPQAALNYDGLTTGCYPYAGPTGKALKLDCTEGQQVLSEMSVEDNCDGTPSRMWVFSSEGLCLNEGGDPWTARFSCATQAPLAWDHFSRQAFTDGSCSTPLPLAVNERSGLQQYLPFDTEAFSQPGCDGNGAFRYLLGGANDKALRIRIEFDAADCTGPWEYVDRQPLGVCFLNLDMGRYEITTAPTGIYTPPASVPAGFESWPPANARIFRLCSDLACSDPSTAVSFRYEALGRCDSGVRYTCRGDYMSDVYFADDECTGDLVAADVHPTSQLMAVGGGINFLIQCSEPAGTGLTPRELPTLAQLVYPDQAECGGSPRVTLRTPDYCGNSIKLLSATGRNVSLTHFADSSCVPGADDATLIVTDMECMPFGNSDSARFTSAQSCNVAALEFAEWAGWPTMNPTTVECVGEPAGESSSSSSSTGGDGAADSSSSSSSGAEDSSSSSSSGGAAADSSSSSSARGSSSSSSSTGGGEPGEGDFDGAAQTAAAASGTLLAAVAVLAMGLAQRV